MRDPEVVKLLDRAAGDPDGDRARTSSRRSSRRDLERWANVIKTAGIKAE